MRPVALKIARTALSLCAFAAVAAMAQVPGLPNRLTCTYDAVGHDPAYSVLVAFDQKTQKVYTSRGGKIMNATITDDEVSIMHLVIPPDGERELTITTINRHTGEIVMKRDGGGVLETGKCVRAAD